MSDILLLNCWVLGDTLNRIFPVQIEKSKSVYSLKKMIVDKKPNAFRSVDPCMIDLYCASEEVANLDDEELIEALKIPVEEGGHRKLRPRDVLSEIFMGVPPPTMLHILVQPPSDCGFFVVMRLLIYSFTLLMVFYFSIHAQINPLSLYQM
ncbi:hypothetical protein SCLCIDRAFT_143296 [Scleroderma citrinum Foug A]|uniref:Crinkler effector protein N-terminal domain-containing protein n=1 Tax=Scleroderma citrinum Foug A TaxID=1036808 RepID=A0A0C3D4S8_9AGAM|nr:hypothetical protein SCLCIDRAFT_143296 [Scleroderma citrinum Foug A]